jgi:hypothetical protein
MPINHKELLEQLARTKALRESAGLTPGRAEDYAPLALDVNRSSVNPVLNNMVARVGVNSQKASDFESMMNQNEANFQQYIQAQKQYEQAQQSLRRAQKMQALQAQYNGGGGRGGLSARDQKYINSLPIGDKGGQNYGKVGATKGRFQDPTPLNLRAGLRTVGSPYGRITVNASTADNFVGFLRALHRTGYRVTSLGSYANRNIAGTNTRSLHSYGLAIDINPSANPVAYGKVITNLPKGIGRLAAKYGLAWGGNWNGSKKDPMHFSVPAYGTK